MSWLIPLAILGVVVIYFMTPQERVRGVRRCLDLLKRARVEAVQHWTGQPHDPQGGRSSGPPIATWAIVGVNVAVFCGMLVGSRPFGDPGTLTAWGGNFGPRTTNGEWWRLVTASFVHAGPLHLLAALAGLVQAGYLAERTLGRVALLSTYLGAGALANLVCLYTSPVSVATGAAGAILGVYGLLAATWTWRLLRGPRVRIPAETAQRLVPSVAVFLLYVALTNRLGRAAYIAAFAYGAISGFLLARGAGEQGPAARRVGALAAVTAVLVLVLAVPLRGLTDVRPEISRVIAIEDRTTIAYDAAVLRFTNGAIPATALAQLIDQTIVPQLRAARDRLASLQRVPPEHRHLVALAQEYLRLRDASWCLRSEALRKSRMRALREADRKEWEAREALGKIRDLNPGRT